MATSIICDIVNRRKAIGSQLVYWYMNLNQASMFSARCILVSCGGYSKYKLAMHGTEQFLFASSSLTLLHLHAGAK